MTREEELELVNRVKAGDGKAFESLADYHHGYIMDMVLSRQTSSSTIEDLTQEATIGLWEAIMKFDGEKGVKLLSYASYHILKRICAYQSMLNPLYIPRTYATEYSTAVKKLELRGETPTPEKLASMTLMSEETASLVMKAHGQALSLDIPRKIHGKDKPDTDTIGEALSDGVDWEELSVDGCVTDSMLDFVDSTMCKRWRYILSSYYGLEGRTPKNLRELATEMGVSLQAVQQKLHKAEKKLREHFATA